MTVYVYRGGALVPRHLAERKQPPVARSDLPAPALSRMEPFESPVTGKEITSWRERDADMKASDSVDPRDFGRDHKFRRGRAAQAEEARRERSRQPEPFWRDLPD